jgi:2-oxoisovalerate dehydrogenase E1 component alpha subunit
VTYRADAHSTSDDPSRYRPKEEYKAWPLGDPVERLKDHMVSEGMWSDAQHAELTDELTAHVDECWEQALSYGTMTEGPQLDKNELFEDVFKDMPRHLIEQREQLRALEDD